jgi:hypothetical protein
MDGTYKLALEHRNGLAGMQTLGIKPGVPHQWAQILEFRPISIFLSRSGVLISHVDELTTALSGYDRRDGKSYHVNFLQTWARDMVSEKRDLWKAWTLAVIWRGTANVYRGVTSRPRSRSALMTLVDTEPNALESFRPVKNSPITKQYGPPWWRSLDLYPLGAAIPIHYVTTAKQALIVARRFLKSKVIGIDITTAPGFKVHRSGQAPPIDFMMLASDDEVAIFHLSIMKYLNSFHPLFRSTLGNPAILKAGVNVEFQQRMLQRYYGLDMEACQELAPAQERPRLNDELEDPNWEMLSSLATDKLGGSLPKLDLVRARHDVGASDPSSFFVGEILLSSVR